MPSTEARKKPLPVFYFIRILHANGKRSPYDERELSSKVAVGAMIKESFFCVMRWPVASGKAQAHEVEDHATENTK